MRFAPAILLVSMLGLLVAFPAPADETKNPVKLGGGFEVQSVKDIPYVDGDAADPKQKLDLYLPKGQKDFPVLFFVHGGSWKSGDRKLYAPLGNILARNGIGTVIISYRLSPQVQHPGHIQDVSRAFAWTCANIAKHGGRTDQVFVCGHSAGGHLVALLATDEKYLKAEKRSLSDIKGTIAISGVYTITPGPIFEGAFGKDEDAVKNASPILHVKEKLCPFCILYAEKDFPFLDQMAEEMAKKLQTNKCDANICRIKDRDHTSIIRNACGSEEDPVTQMILEFVAKHSRLKLAPKGN
jgi:acetyl esterase/lipase